MPDEPQEQVIEPTGEETKETTTETTPTVEELQKQVAELSKLEETRKNEIAGLNRANTEQATKYQELLKKTETEAETKEREAKEAAEKAEQERNDFLNQKAEFSKKENDFNVKVKALELGFTAEDIEMLKFPNVEAVESYKAYLDKRDASIKEGATKEIETALKGGRDVLNNGVSKSTPYEDILNGGLDS